MPDDERIEQLELQNKVLQANNKGLKETIEELRNQNAELRDELEVKNAELNKEKEKNKELHDLIYKKLKLNIIENGMSQNDYISKDKIKAKIEEYENRRDKAPITSIEYDIYVCIIQVLQELLKSW